jgi:uncharacterized membrane protein
MPEVEKSTAGGALGGAVIGLLTGGPIGLVVGGVLGGLGGHYFGADDKKEEKSGPPSQP